MGIENPTLIETLGYRAPSLPEVSRSLFGAKPETRTRAPVGRFFLPSALLSAEPLISYSGIVPRAPLGVASILRGRLFARRAWFLLSPTWTIEDETVARALRGKAVVHRVFNPLHRFIFMCNTEGEAEMMLRHGEAAFVHNKTTNVSEAVFRPLESESVEFDAIYNAQLVTFKRHELTLDIPSCAFLFHRGNESPDETEAALIARHRRVAPGHMFINEFDAKGVPVRLPPEDVNRHLNRALVGLCLSAKEGAMFACAEYLLAGLPVVTTPNKGGRDFYGGDEFYVTAAADPREIAAAVAALKSRAIPRQIVRERTLRRMSAERARFVELVNAIYAESGVAEQFKGFWPPKRAIVMAWNSPNNARKRMARGIVDELFL